MYGYIYKTTNLINDKIYIGQKKSIKFVDSYYGSGKYLNNSLKLHGKENFTVEVLEWCLDKQQLDDRERFWITYYRECGYIMYNIARGGEGGDICSYLSKEDKERRRKLLQEHSHFANLTKEQSTQMHKKAWKTRRARGHDKMSKEQREKLKESHKGFVVSEETKRKLSILNKGKIIPPEVRTKISESNKGKIISEESRKRMSISRKGKYTGQDNHFYGKTHSQEIKQLIGSYNKERFKDRKWVNNGDINKRVLISELSIYKEQGFIEGRIKFK